MNTWKVILATMVIFATGVVTGGLLVYHVDVRVPHARRPNPQARPTPATPAGVVRLDFLRRAQRELDLTAEQREQIDKVLKENQERSRKLLDPVLQRTRREFLEVLTPEQRTKFEQLVKQQQQRLREQRRLAGIHEQHTNEPAPATNAP